MTNYLLQVDQAVFYWFNSLLEINYFFSIIIEIIGKYFIYFVPIGLLSAWFIWRTDKDRIAMIKATLVSVFIWQVLTRIIALLWFRPRPFVELSGTKELFFHLPSYSFPSDHAAFLIALGLYFYLLGYKKPGIWIIIGSIIVGIARLISGLHYPGDIIAGLILGLISAWLLFYLDKYIEKFLAKPLLKIAKFIKFA